MANYLAGMVQPHQIMGQAQQLQTPFELQAGAIQIQSAKNKLLQEETQRNALAQYAQTGELESLRAAPDLYFEAMKQQQPKYQLTSYGAPGGQQQRAFVDPRNPFATPIPVGDPYKLPNFYDQMAYGALDIPVDTPVTSPEETVLPTPARVVTPQAEEIPIKADPIPKAPREQITGISPRDRATMRMEDVKQASKSLEEMAEKKAVDRGFVQDIDRFLSLNQEVETGPIAGSYLVAGVRGITDPRLQEMQSISDKLTPLMRQGMPGAASDRDVAMFKSATVGIAKDREANRNVGLGLKASRVNAIDRASFMQEYFDKNQTLRGAEAQWDRYLEANPIFDPYAPTGSFEINPNRQPYKDFFAGKWAPKIVRYGGKKIKITDPKKYKAFLEHIGQE